jgi:hypothetical protein
MNDVAISRQDVQELQRSLMHMPQVEPVTTHYFADGMYARTVFRKAGVMVIGKIHRKEHFFSIVQGEMSVLTDAGMERHKAPWVIVSPIGTKRITFAHEDSTVMTVHRVSSQDLEAIEEELVEFEGISLYGPGNLMLKRALEEMK